jgi:integrase
LWLLVAFCVIIAFGTVTAEVASSSLVVPRHSFQALERAAPAQSAGAGYETLWKTYLAPYLQEISLRDFRTADACNLFAEIHRHHKIGRSTLQHCKHRLSGIFTLARNQGALDAPNPIQGAMVPKKAAAPGKTHAASPEEVLAILEVLEKASQLKACAAVGLMFFAGLRPGEARGARWEDFDGKRLFVRQSVWHTHTTTPKTEDSEGVVPIIEALRSILEDIRAADGNPTAGPILRGPSGKPIILDNLSKRVVAPLLAGKGNWLARLVFAEKGSSYYAGRTHAGWSGVERSFAPRKPFDNDAALRQRCARKHENCHATTRGIVHQEFTCGHIAT